jgi:hypothetical protein
MPAPMVQHLVYQSTIHQAPVSFLQLSLVLKLKNKEIIRQHDDKHASKKKSTENHQTVMFIKSNKKMENVKHNIGTR